MKILAILIAIMSCANSAEPPDLKRFGRSGSESREANARPGPAASESEKVDVSPPKIRSVMFAAGPIRPAEPGPVQPQESFLSIREVTLSILMVLVDDLHYTFSRDTDIATGLRIGYSFPPVQTLGTQPLDGAEVATFPSAVPSDLRAAIAKRASEALKVAGLEAFSLELEIEERNRPQ